MESLEPGIGLIRCKSWKAALAIAFSAMFFSPPMYLCGQSVATAHSRPSQAKTGHHSAPKAGGWTFLVSGDSRNCGDVVMPAIAAQGTRYAPLFYWHLGDLRAIYKIDEDIAAAGDFLPPEDDGNGLVNCGAYEKDAWPDFIEHQIGPFGAMPFYVGIGNHERTAPKNEDQFTAQFADWLDSPVLRQQRLKDDPWDHLLKPYYHWRQGGVDFLYLDNASDSFSSDQMTWFEHVLSLAAKDSTTHSLVVGMHEALPGSLASDHSMGSKQNEPESAASGTHVYQALLAFREQTHKPVYVLASHSHFYMDGIFDRLPENQRLPGWIVGTAGAIRYKLPEGAPSTAKTDVYGYLLGKVAADGKITFEFKKVSQSDVPDNLLSRYPTSFIAWCFAHNSQNVDPDTKDTNRCAPPESTQTK